MSTETNRQLTPTLGLKDSIYLLIGSMVGSGIFIVPAAMTRDIGGMGFFIISFIIGSVITIIAAFNYSELASIMPAAGGQYVYLREIYGHKTGFLYGWTLFTVIQTGAIAAVAVACGKFTNELLKYADMPMVLPEFLSWLNSESIIAIAMVWILTFINIKGNALGTRLQNILTLTKFVAIFGLVIGCFALAKNLDVWKFNWDNLWNTTHITKTPNNTFHIENLTSIWAIISAVSTGLIGTIFCLDYWNSLSFMAAEVKNPTKTIPKAFVFGIVFTSITYILLAIAFCFILPTIGNPNGQSIVELGMPFAYKDRIGSAIAISLLGNTGGIVICILILISVFSCNNGLILSGARVYYVMAKDKIFFSKLSYLNKHNVPSKSLIWQSIWVSILCLSGQYSALLDYVVLAIMIFYIITILGVYILRKRQPNIPRPIKAFGYPYLTILYIIVALFICINIILMKPINTIPCIVIILLGLPVYYFFQKNNS